MRERGATARVSTAATAHHDSTGICAPSSSSDHVAQPDDFRLDARKALHQRDIAERVGRRVSARSE